MGIRQRWANLSMRYKMVIMLYVVILPFLIILGSFFYVILLNNFRSEVAKAYDGVANQIYSSVQYLQTDIQDFSTYICINDTMYNILNDDTPTDDIYATEDAGRSLRFILDIIATKSHINALGIYSNKGQPLYQITTDTSTFQQDINKIIEMDSYDVALEANGASIWYSINSTDTALFERNTSDKVVMSRVIFNYIDVEPIGYLVIGINSKYIEDMCRNSLRAEEDGIVIFYDGQMLMSVGRVPESFTLGLENVENTTVIKGYGNDEKLEVYYLLSDSVVNVRKRTLVLAIVGGAFIVLLVLLPIESSVANRLLKRLKELLASMNKLEKGDFSQRVDFNSKDEIGEIGYHYNRMVRSIKELIDTNYRSQLHERESQLLALQAQINPHFLYNTLDSIYWKAMEEGSESAAKMTYSLSNLFRLSLNKGSGMTILKSESELLMHYLEIQKERFGNKLNVDVSITEDAKNAKIPTFILQPFVENAIIHGIEPSENGGEVNVIGWCEGDVLRITISDTGAGMSPSKMHSLMKKPSSKDIHKLSGYAVYNVNERLKLTYEDDFTLAIISNPGKGTQVEISLPYETR